MYVTNKLVRFQKHEIDPIVDFLFRGMAFLSSDSKLTLFVHVFLQFVVRRQSISGVQWRSLNSWVRNIKHHEIRTPDLKNSKGLYFRKLYVAKDPEARVEWNALIDESVDNAILFAWGGSERRVNAMMRKIRDHANITPDEYAEIVDYMDSIGYQKYTMPAWGDCQIISLADLEKAS